jgi:hypothetical protein
VQRKAVQAFTLNNIVCFVGAYQCSYVNITVMIVNVLWLCVNIMYHNLV